MYGFIITNGHGFHGGGINCINNSSPNLKYLNISGNSSDENGGGVYCRYSSNPNLVNSILFNDFPEEVFFFENDPSNTITFSYSDIQGGETGIVTNNNGTVNWLEGNINQDPIFLNTGDHPYSLTELSPCIDTGIQDTTGLNLPEFDLAGNSRIFNDRIDMGAYEWQDFSTNGNDVLETLCKMYNYPNPFNPSTTISFSLTQSSSIVEIVIYNLKGQKVKTFTFPNGSLGTSEESVVWNGKDESGNLVESGIYYYKLNVNGETVDLRKCLLLK